MKVFMTIGMILVLGGLASGFISPPVGPVSQTINAAQTSANTKATLSAVCAVAATTYYTDWFLLGGEEIIGVEIENTSATVALDVAICQLRDDGDVRESGTAYDYIAGADWVSLAGSQTLPFQYYPSSSSSYLPNSLAAATKTHSTIWVKGHSAVRFGFSAADVTVTVKVRLQAQ